MKATRQKSDAERKKAAPETSFHDRAVPNGDYPQHDSPFKIDSSVDQRKEARTAVASSVGSVLRRVWVRDRLEGGGFPLPLGPLRVDPCELGFVVASEALL